MTTARFAPPNWLPTVVGLGSGVLVLVGVEILVRLGAINRFIVPLPSEIFSALRVSSPKRTFRAASCRRLGNAWPRACCSRFSASRSAR